MTRRRWSKGFPLWVVLTCSASLAVTTPSTASAQTLADPDVALAGADRIGAVASGTVHADAASPRFAGLDSVVMYSAAGAPPRIVRTGNGKASLGAVAQLHGRIPADTLARLREAYSRFIQTSGRGENRFAMTLQVLDALEAPTKEEYRRQIGLLPVRVESIPTVGEDGRVGTRKDYFVANQLRMSTFESPRALEVAHALAEDQPLGGPSAAVLDAGSAAPSNCEYIAEDGTPFSGPCATPQEIEDAMTTLVVLEADGDIAYDDYEYARSVYCFYYPGDLDLCLADSPPPDAEMAGLPPADESEACGGPYVSSVWDDTITRPCLMEGIQGGLAAVAWVGAKVGAVAVMTSAAPPAGAVGWAIFGVASTGFALAGSAASFLSCLGYD